MGLFVTLSINDIPHNGTQQTSIEFYCAEFLDYLNVMLSGVMLNVVMLSVIMLNVIVLSVVAPKTNRTILLVQVCYICRVYLALTKVDPLAAIKSRKFIVKALARNLFS
jgi:hypothetical protein